MNITRRKIKALNLEEVMIQELLNAGVDLVTQEDFVPAMIVAEAKTESDYQMLAEIRAQMPNVPIVVIGEDRGAEHAAFVRKTAAHGFVVKRENYQLEVIAQMENILEWMSSLDYADSDSIKVDKEATLDLQKRRIRVKDRSVSLTPKQTSLLHTLLLYKGLVVSNERLIRGANLTGEGDPNNALRVHMHRLRRKLKAILGESHLILTQRRNGYQLISNS